jgi:acetyltransferase-like isoleucine patch superfamily enzyme
MLSYGIIIRNTDSHSVIDVKSGKRRNPAADIIVGDHVWIGMEALLTKGTHVSNNSIVGARAVLTKPYLDENISLAGVPAKIINTGISWDRKKL